MAVLNGLNVKDLNTWYSAAYTSQTQEQQRFTLSEVVADWYELMTPQRIMQPWAIDCLF